MLLNKALGVLSVLSRCWLSLEANFIEFNSQNKSLGNFILKSST